MGVYTDIRVDSLKVERALDEVSSQRRALALGYSAPGARRQSLAAYLLLKRALRAEYGIEDNPVFAFAPDGGKPYLRDYPEIHFNLSHTHGVAACALAGHPVGIDVERIAPFDAAVAERVLSVEELRAVRESPEPEVAFARLWTMKEALLKLRGCGIADDRTLPGLLAEVPPTAFCTTVDREHGHVLTVTQSRKLQTPP